MNEGWIKLNRSLLQWEWYDDDAVLRLWLHLLLTVNFEAKRWHGQVIQPGQIITSIANLSLATGLSIRQVRTALDKLQSTGEITIRATNKFTLVTVEKWAFFQGADDASDKQMTNKRQTNDKQTTNKRQTNDKQTTTTKERKEREERKESNKERKSSSSKASGIREQLTEAEYDELEKRYGLIQSMELIDAVHEEVIDRGRQIDDAFAYVVGYADKKGVRRER